MIAGRRKQPGGNWPPGWYEERAYPAGREVDPIREPSGAKSAASVPPDGTSNSSVVLPIEVRGSCELDRLITGCVDLFVQCNPHFVFPNDRAQPSQPISLRLAAVESVVPAELRPGSCLSISQSGAKVTDAFASGLPFRVTRPETGAVLFDPQPAWKTRASRRRTTDARVGWSWFPPR